MASSILPKYKVCFIKVFQWKTSRTDFHNFGWVELYEAPYFWLLLPLPPFSSQVTLFQCCQNRWHEKGDVWSPFWIYISHLSHSHSWKHACTNVHTLERSKHFLIDIWVRKRNDSEKEVSIFCFLQHTVFNVSLFYIPIFLMYGGKVFRCKKV